MEEEGLQKDPAGEEGSFHFSDNRLKRTGVDIILMQGENSREVDYHHFSPNPHIF